MTAATVCRRAATVLGLSVMPLFYGPLVPRPCLASAYGRERFTMGGKTTCGALTKRLSEKGSDPLPNRVQIPQTESKSLQKAGGLTPFRIASKQFGRVY